MIQANDLRIGNYIADRGGKKWQIDHWESKDKVSAKSSISEIGGHKFEGHPLTEYVEYLQPIPLTEEILLKCGFSEKNKWFFKDGIMLGYITTDENLQCEWKLDCGDPKWNLIDIKYLHQLQNLYFALTGEELDIDLSR